jgi:hypothetical protein
MCKHNLTKAIQPAKVRKILQLYKYIKKKAAISFDLETAAHCSYSSS